MIKLKKLIMEDPDTVRYKSNAIRYIDSDAVTFIYDIDDDKFYREEQSPDENDVVMHGPMLRKYDLDGHTIIQGRYWTNSKIISIWELLYKYNRRFATETNLKKVFDNIKKFTPDIYSYKMDLDRSPNENSNTLVPVKWFFKNYSMCINTLDFKVDTQRLPHIVPLQKLQKDELDAYMIKGIISKEDYEREMNRRKTATTVYKPNNY
jgi:hypothetical protein